MLRKRDMKTQYEDGAAVYKSMWLTVQVVIEACGDLRLILGLFPKDKMNW